MSALPALDQFRHAKPLAEGSHDEADVLEELKQWAEIAPAQATPEHDQGERVFDEIDAAALQAEPIDEKRFPRPLRVALFVTLSIASWAVVLGLGHMAATALHG